jgi:hypothetical protein
MPLFQGNRSSIPDDGPPEPKEISNALNTFNGTLIFIGFATGEILVFICLILLWIHKSNTYIRASSIDFSVMILVGCALSFLSLYFFIGAPTRIYCNLQIWLQVLGFIIVLSGLIVKELRVFILFKSKTAAKYSIIGNELKLIGIALLMCLVDIVLLVIWSTVMNPTVHKHVIVDDTEGDLNTFNLICKAAISPDYSAPISKALYSYNGIVLLVMGVVSCLNFSSDSIFSESYFLMSSFLNLLFTAILRIPVRITSYAYTPTNDFNWSISVWCNFLIFTPNVCSLNFISRGDCVFCSFLLHTKVPSYSSGLFKIKKYKNVKLGYTIN